MDLIYTLKQRGKVSRAEIDAYSAELLADVEKQLCATYPANNPAWAKITAEAAAVVAKADEQIAARCKQMGIREEFRPTLSLSWYERGENAIKERRRELRALAEKKIEALVREAKMRLLRDETTAAEAITIRGLASSEAKELFANLPTVEQLMPKIKIEDLDSKLPVTDRYGRPSPLARQFHDS
jgi:hypothetical protein